MVDKLQSHGRLVIRCEWGWWNEVRLTIGKPYITTRHATDQFDRPTGCVHRALEVPGIEPGTSRMRSERSTTEPHPRPSVRSHKRSPTSTQVPHNYTTQSYPISSLNYSFHTHTHTYSWKASTHSLTTPHLHTHPILPSMHTYLLTPLAHNGA